jgi:acetylornithine deacetylase/succinyl-diaminopimelate desuccinylase-like protein
MKGGVAMMLATLLQAKAEGFMPAGDVVLAILSDEERLGDHGAKYLVENHAEQFEGIRYAIGEFGGFTSYLGRRKFYPIQVAEKQVCHLRATVRGRGGHGSMPLRDSAVVKLGPLLQSLTCRRLPVHITPAARQMLTSAALALPLPTSLGLRLLLMPDLTDTLLNLLGDKGRVFDPLLHNSVNVAEVRGDANEIVLELGGLLLPGYSPDVLMAELRHLIGDQVELELIRYDPGPSEPDMGLFSTLADILEEADPGSIPLPQLSPAITDARFFSQLGIQTYGFVPMKLPANPDLVQTIHAADERIPVGAVRFGQDAIYQVLQRYEG